MRVFTISLICLVALPCVVFAAEIESVSPACGAAGDFVLIRGSGFSEDPTVTFGGVDARVMRSNEGRILCRVPDGVEPGAVTLVADGATADFDVLEPGAPIILHISSESAIPGMYLIVIGDRLKDCVAEFEKADGTVVARVDLIGRCHVAVVEVPSDIATGTYTLRIVNSDGNDSGPCSPTVKIVEAGTPTLDSIEPESQIPGGKVLCNGTDLRPAGLCSVAWTDADGTTLTAVGLSNGYGKVYSYVPGLAKPGGTYDVVVRLADGKTTLPNGVLSYEVGQLPPPKIMELDPAMGPVKSLFVIRGTGLVRAGLDPTVEFTNDSGSTEADVVSAAECCLCRDKLVVRVPADLADGDYDVTVTVGDATSNAKVFTVGELPLTVTSMKPDTQGMSGPWGPIHIEGTGFGSPDEKLDVTWDDGSGSDPITGQVVYHDDRRIMVVPPGGWDDPLPEAEYTVRVVIHPGTADEESVEAGTYTVKKSDGRKREGGS